MSVAQIANLMLGYELSDTVEGVLSLRPVSASEAFDRITTAIKQDFGPSKFHPLETPDMIERI